jgi:two-component system chemotaxis sensor kinase CheA
MAAAGKAAAHKENIMTDLSLLQDFVTETVEHLEEMEGNLLQLESDPGNRETLNDIFRSVHTIKGAAEYMGLERIAELSHKLENLLDLMRHNERSATSQIIDLLMAARDRLGLLATDLHQNQREQTEIDDLLDRIQSLDGQKMPAMETASPTAEDGLTDSSASPGGETYEEEHDEELFGIFLEQLQEGLEALQSWTEALTDADDTDQVEILGRCLGQIDPLRSSANYMGYGKLTELYDRWHKAIQSARERLDDGDDGFMPGFLTDEMQASLDEICAAFPQLNLSPPEPQTVPLDNDTVSSATPAISEESDHLNSTATADDDELPNGIDLFAEEERNERPLKNEKEGTLDLALLQDFITETVEHLSEMEDRLLQLESHPDDRDILNDIFRSMHTIKGAAEYMGMRRIAELSHKLENLLDLMRHGKLATSRDVIDLLMASRDRIGILTADLHQTQSEQADIDDLLSRIQSLVKEEPGPQDDETPQTGTEHEADRRQSTETTSQSEVYEEEYDEELFTIFLEQLQEGLDTLQALTVSLTDADRADRIEIIGRCLTHIDPLRSSANYMGYRNLTGLYDRWLEAIRTAEERLTGEDDTFMPAFIAGCMQATIDDIRRCFPRLAPSTAVPATAVADETQPLAEGNSSNEFGEMADDLLDVYATAPAILSVENSAPGPASDLKDEDNLFDRLSRSFDQRMDENQIVGTSTAPSSGMDWELFSEDRDEEDLAADTTLTDPDALDEEDPLAAYAIMPEGEIPEAAQETAEPQGVPSLWDDFDADDDAVSAEENEEESSTSSAGLSRAHLAATDLLDREAPAASHEEEEALSPLPMPAADQTPSPVVETSEAPQDALAQLVEKKPSIDLDRSPGDRRNPLKRGRRQSDRIGEQLLRQSIRVDAGKIDALMNQVGELVVSRAWFSQLFHEMRDLQQNLQHHANLESREMKQVKGLTFRLSEATVALGRVANELQEGVMKVRMLPIAQLFNRYPRLVFDLVRNVDKKVQLDIKGEETELDKMVIESISDPLIHIIRNAVDHGIEAMEERKRLGKPESGTIHLEAYHEGNHVVIEIADDGRGLDMERIKAKALSGGFASREEIDRMPPKELTGLIMQPGFSTAAEITHTSGRGVGMDVVKQNIEKLNGTIEIDSTPGVETRFRIKIPLTLAIIPALLVQVRGELFTIPLSTVEETIRIAPKDLSTIEGVEVMQLRDSTLPLVRLAGLFNMPADTSGDGRAFVVVVSTGMKRVGLVVDTLLGQEEVVIKPLEDYLQEKSGFSGATILGDGRISLILDIYELVNLSIDRQARRKQVAVPA